MLPPAGGGAQDEWLGYAREIFIASLRIWHGNGLGTAEQFFDALATAEREKLALLCEGTAAQHYFAAGNERMLGSILGTMAPRVEIMRQAARVGEQAFSVRSWIRAEGHGTLWVPYQAHQITAPRELISCWMGLAITEVLALPDSTTRRIWFHLDEFDALGPLQGLKDAQARLRKKGGCVVIGLQSIDQVRAVYGVAAANTIIENCGNVLILRCGASERGGAAQFASELIGKREVEHDETTTSRSKGREHTTGSTARHVRRRTEKAVLASQIMQLADRSVYLRLADETEWKKVRFDYVPFQAGTEPYVPAPAPRREAAEGAGAGRRRGLLWGTIEPGERKLAYANSYYDPDWKVVHDRHHEERERASQEMERLTKAGEMDSEAYNRAKASFDRHHEAACLAALKMPHATVEEFAEWLFREFPVDAEDFGARIPVLIVDFTEFRTVDEVDATWRRFHKAARNSAYEKQASLPVGQPYGLKTFADAASPKLLCYWRHFEPSELYPGRCARGSGVRTPITADQQEDGWHVCFMQDWNIPGTPVAHEIERLASVIYREACAAAGQPAAASGLPGWLGHRLVRWRPATIPDPDGFHFYQHIPPNPQGCRETFERVVMRFERGEYRDPDWAKYAVIPKVIQSTRLECAVENPPLGRQVALLP